MYILGNSCFLHVKCEIKELNDMLKYLKNLEINNMSIIKSTILLETQKY